MADTMDIFVNLDLGDGGNSFADEYDNLNRCEEPSPASEAAELDLAEPMEHLQQYAAEKEDAIDVQMVELVDLEEQLQQQLGASLGTSWDAGVIDSLAQMRVHNLEEYTAAAARLASDQRLPGSWPAETLTKQALLTVPGSAAATTAAPAAFTLSDIAPPSLPQEQSLSSRSGAGSAACSEAGEAVFCSDAQERSPKRRASESIPRAGPVAVSVRTGHKRSVSNVTNMLTTMTPIQDTDSRRSKSDTEGSAEPTRPSTLEGQAQEGGAEGDDSISRRKDRLLRNRAAALASRERKREHVIRLEATVQQMELDAASLKQENGRLQQEMARMQALLTKHGIELTETSTSTAPGIAIVQENMEARSASLAARADKASEPVLARLKAAPTGFSPRGALKKSQILANPVAAEEYLRQVALRAPTTVPTETAALGQEVPKEKGQDKEETKQIGGGGSVVIMILCFGIALFASVNTTAPHQGFALSNPCGSGSATGLANLAAVDAILGSPAAMGARAGNAAALQDMIEQFKLQGFQLTEPMQAGASLSTEAMQATCPDAVIKPKAEDTSQVDTIAATAAASSPAPSPAEDSHTTRTASTSPELSLLAVPESTFQKRTSRRRSSRASAMIKEETE